MIRDEDLPHVIPSDLPQLSGARWGEQDRSYREPALAIIGGPSVPAWTPEQFAEWLRSMGCPDSEVPSVTDWFNRHRPVVPIDIQPKMPTDQAWGATDGRGGRAIAHAQRLARYGQARGLTPTVTVTGPASARVHLGPEEWRTVDVHVDRNGDLVEYEALGPTIPFTKEPA